MCVCCFAYDLEDADDSEDDEDDEDDEEDNKVVVDDDDDSDDDKSAGADADTGREPEELLNCDCMCNSAKRRSCSIMFCTNELYIYVYRNIIKI